MNLNASPYYAGRLHERETMLATRAADASVPVVYANLVGGQDELVFDGGSLVIDEQGELVARAKQFEEDLLVVDLDVRAAFRKRLLDPRGRPRSTSLPEVAVTEAHLGERRSPARIEPVASAGARGLRGPRARHARLRAQERLLRRAHRALGRGRLRDRRDDRGRRARRRARDRCAHAVALLERSQRHRRRGHRGQSRYRHADGADRARAPGVRGDARRRAREQRRPDSPRRTCSRASAATC